MYIRICCYRSDYCRVIFWRVSHFLKTLLCVLLCVCKSVCVCVNYKIHFYLNFQERSESFISKLKPKSYPGKPLPQTCKHISMSQDDINKMKKFENLLESSTLNIECLRQLSWSGIPVKIRAETWRLLTGYTTITPNKRNEILATKRISYKNLVRQCYFIEKDEINQKIYKQIKIDIPRMNPAILIFQQNVVQDIFERILYLWAVRNPTTGYVQGINDLVTPFFVVFLLENIQNENEVENIDVGSVPQEIRDNIEADTFWCLSKFLNHIQENYALSQLGIQKTIDKLRNLIQRIDYTLHNHLISNGVDYLQFSYRWINNLLTRELPLPCIIRLWDTYLAEFESFGTFHLYVCAAFLLHWKDLLLQEIDFQGLILLLQNLPAKNWTVFDIRVLMAEAYRLKFTFEGAPRHLQCYKNS